MKTCFKIAILFCVIYSVCHAKILYVDQKLSDGFWRNAYVDLNVALQHAEAGDEIWIARGIYTPGRESTDSFILKDGIKMYGGFYGGEVNLDDRDVYSNITILSGDIGIPDQVGDNVHHVLKSSGDYRVGSSLDGFIIQDGNAKDGKGGGAILLHDGAFLNIKNCKFINNGSNEQGGAVSINPETIIECCLFDNNTAKRGGAIFVEKSSDPNSFLNIKRSTFVNNIADKGSAIFTDYNMFKLDSSVMWNNKNRFGKLNSICKDVLMNNKCQIQNIVVDDPSFTLIPSEKNIIIYHNLSPLGPFTNKQEYYIVDHIGVPKEFGYKNVSNLRRLNYKCFMEGQF